MRSRIPEGDCVCAQAQQVPATASVTQPSGACRRLCGTCSAVLFFCNFCSDSHGGTLRRPV